MSTQRLREVTAAERFDLLELPATALIGPWHWRGNGETAFRDVTDGEGRYQYLIQFMPLACDMIYESFQPLP